MSGATFKGLYYGMCSPSACDGVCVSVCQRALSSRFLVQNYKKVLTLPKICVLNVLTFMLKNVNTFYSTKVKFMAIMLNFRHA